MWSPIESRVRDSRTGRARCQTCLKTPWRSCVAGYANLSSDDRVQVIGGAATYRADWIYGSDDVACAAASISSAVCTGCTTGRAWEDSTSTAVEPARCAMNSDSAAGSIGCCAAAMICICAGSTSGVDLGEALGSQVHVAAIRARTDQCVLSRCVRRSDGVCADRCPRASGRSANVQYDRANTTAHRCGPAVAQMPVTRSAGPSPLSARRHHSSAASATPRLVISVVSIVCICQSSAST
jgi:hypothetical protein